jgi:hypothetical protein
MGLACTLGLSACLAFGGNAIPAQDALEILDNCELLKQLPPSSFIQVQPTSMADVRRAAMAGMGAATGEAIEEKGLLLEWPQNGAVRKGLWLRRCAQFEVAFNDRSNWTHLDRFPK